MADTTIMRRNNLQTILEAIDLLGAATTVQLRETTALSLATISRVTGQLKAKGLILQSYKPTSEPGRKPEIFTLNTDYGTGIYFNLRTGYLEGYLLDFAGSVLRRLEYAVSSDLTVETFISLAKRLTCALAESTSKPLAACLSLPGQQDREQGTVCRIPNFPAFEGAALQQELEQALGCPCMVVNTARITAWGHFLGQHERVRNLIFLEITDDCGIGAGLVLDGKLYEDTLGLAGEVGDMIVQLQAPEQKKLPTEGALEATSGILTILKHAREILPTQEPLSLPVLEDMAHSGNAGILALLRQASRAWAAAIINLSAVLSPDQIVVGGAISEENGLIRSLIGNHLQSMYHRPVSISFAPRDCLCHAHGAGDVLKRFLFSAELDHIDE